MLITARHSGDENVWPVDWHLPLSLKPELYGVAIHKGSFGQELIAKSGAFAVNFVPASWEDKILFCGSTSGRLVDKFSEAGLKRGEASTIDAPILTDGLGTLECLVEQVVDVGDHLLFVGRVSHSISRHQAPRLHHLDATLGGRGETPG